MVFDYLSGLLDPKREQREIKEQTLESKQTHGKNKGNGEKLILNKINCFCS